MTSYRALLVASAIAFTAAMTSVASACCDWAPVAPVVYAQPAPLPVYAGGCGGCGCGLCGGCGGCAPAVIAAPVLPAPAPAWGCGGCAATYIEPTPIAPAPIYVVNQGPDYTGPGIIVPYHTYSPAAAYSPAVDYPYVPNPAYAYGSGYAGGYYHHHRHYGPRYAYHRYWRYHGPLRARD